MAGGQLSVFCMRHAHDQCGHWMGVGIELIGKNRGSSVMLCTCGCHSGCPIAGRESVPEDDWKQLCTCPGGDELRSRFQRTEHEQKERGARLRAAMADVHTDGHRSADELQADLVRAYDTHGVERESDLRGTAEFLSATTARKGTRLLRISGVGVRSLRRLHRAAKDAGPGDAEDQLQVGHNRNTTRSMFRWTTTYAAIAAAFIAGAWGASGWGSVILAVFAALFSLLTARMLLWCGLMVLLDMAIKAFGARGRGDTS